MRVPPPARAPVGPALALAVAVAVAVAACGRSELTIEDAIALGRDAGTARGGPSGSRDSDAASNPGPGADADGLPASGEGGEFFTSSSGAGDDGSSSATHDGSGGCGPANCAGCCAGGICGTGADPFACGSGGAKCQTCDPERTCTPGGACE